ncbi:MAG: DNA repair protein RecO [Clostridiales bacterium]|nr:DNA repair protein RecO [Clostridiales bacterium]MBR6484401.1 DNA repair protein RecO [Clostridiales bacterium]
MSGPVSTKGLILQTRQYGSNDRMVKLLTKDRGIVNFCAKGAAKQGSRNSFASVPYSLSNVLLTDSHGFLYLKEGAVIESNRGILESIEAMAVAAHFSERLSESVLQSDNAPDCYELAVYAFYALSKDPQNYALIYSAFNWKLLNMLGFTVRYEKYVDSYLSLNDGSVIPCEGRSINDPSYYLMSARAVKILDMMTDAPLKNIFTINTDEKVIEEIRQFTTLYMSSQFDREIEDPLKKIGLN